MSVAFKDAPVTLSRCAVNLSAPQAIPAGAVWTPIDFDNIIYDYLGEWDNTDHVFRITDCGQYLVIANIYMCPPNNHSLWLDINLSWIDYAGDVRNAVLAGVCGYPHSIIVSRAAIDNIIYALAQHDDPAPVNVDGTMYIHRVA